MANVSEKFKKRESRDKNEFDKNGRVCASRSKQMFISSGIGCLPFGMS